MKARILVSLLAVAAGTNIACGQGHIVFSNYTTAAGKVTFGTGTGAEGQGLNSSFHAALYYALGALSAAPDPWGYATPSSLGPFGLLGGNTGLTPPYPTQFQVNNAGLGYFIGPIVTIPDYTTGPITFMIVVYNGADYASSALRSHSSAFTMTSIATNINPAGNFEGLSDFQVLAIPEPCVLSFLILGVTTLIIFHQKR